MCFQSPRPALICMPINSGAIGMLQLIHGKKFTAQGKTQNKSIKYRRVGLLSTCIY